LSDKLLNGVDAERRAARQAAIDQFAGTQLAGPNEDLYREMLVTVCRLAQDQTDRGEVKLLNRALAELRYAFKTFVPYRDNRKVSIFGSSRTPEHHPDYHTAVRFAREMIAQNWMVITGAGDGIMKAGHHGAGRKASFGVTIRLPFEQKTNTVIAGDEKVVNFRYFFTRKLIFIKEASAVVLFPGGFGTQDEGFEALTLIQTGKAPLVPIVMLEQPGGTYWLQWRAYVAAELLRSGMINPQDMDLFRITDDVGTAVRTVCDFYRVYHSMRYVHDELILRLQRPLSGQTLTRLNADFADILASGQIQQVAALPEEEGELPDKPRLRLSFDRKSLGRLRRMMDVINQEPELPGK
jgi:uncharacterized protein (TIGR00730 family)